MKVENIYNIGFYDILYVPYNYLLPVADPALEHFFTIPKWLKKSHKNNKWRITFTNFNLIDPHGPGGGNNPVKTWAVDGLDNKSYFFGRGANKLGGIPYNVYIPSQNALQIAVVNDYNVNVNTYADTYDTAVCCIDQLPQNAMRLTFFMSGYDYGPATGVGGSYFGQPVYIGFNMRIEELSNQTKLIDDLMFQPDVIQTYNQTFTANNNNRVSFNFDPMIRKRNPKNRWLATVLCVGIYDIYNSSAEPYSGQVEIDSLAVNGFNGGIYPQDNYLTGQPYIWVLISSATTGSPTNNAIIVYWLDENENQLGVSTIFEAGEASVGGNAKYVYVPNDIDLSLLKTGRITISATDGVNLGAVNVNGIYSTNIGWIDTNEPLYPAYRDYDMTVSLLDNPLIAELQNYTLLGNLRIIRSNNGGFEWFSDTYSPQQFIMNELPQDFNVIAYNKSLGNTYQISTVKYAPPPTIYLIPNSALTNFSFTIRLEEIV